jgi:histidinol-phosphate/aromatic aminotransferase/cobyric acid decarboxylase-like protein
MLGKAFSSLVGLRAGFFMKTFEIDKKLEEYRERYKTASPAIKKCIVIAANLLKEQREKQQVIEENESINRYRGL